MQLNDIKQHQFEINRALAESNTQKQSTRYKRSVTALKTKWTKLTTTLLSHLDEEEQYLGPSLEKNFKEEEGIQIEQQILKAMPTSELRRQLPWILRAMERWDGVTNTAIWFLRLSSMTRSAQEKQWKAENEGNNVKLMESLTQEQNTFRPVTTAYCSYCCCCSNPCLIL